MLCSFTIGGLTLKPHEYTVGITDEQLGPRQNVVPFADELDEEPCVFCGHTARFPEVVATVWKDWPDRVSWRCADSVACLRRRPR